MPEKEHLEIIHDSYRPESLPEQTSQSLLESPQERAQSMPDNVIASNLYLYKIFCISACLQCILKRLKQIKPNFEW